ncbi:MAG: VOC family protein [Candidatus Mcinerneyibacterium aminivorans]|uniref:VOC family protein n=1 Tax=Candidatus Mcinerneyibacterium aminivorans TaxID=2703815 RepID=A0A5D0MJI0_9BACT|nr:MAG: VOC family protein [Candidatus Mcinerneyibacterium aminivorans]
MMKLKMNTIHVNNLGKSFYFYKNVLNMKKVREFSPRPGTSIIFLKGKSEFMIELIADKNEEVSKKVSSNLSMGFIVENMDKTVKNLKEKNVEIIRGPMEVSGNTKLAFIRDPNGVEIEFIESPDM